MNNEDLQAIALQASIGVGTYIVNDYLITVAQSEDGNGYTLTIRKGAEIQTIHLTELTQEYVDNCIQTALAEAKASGEFDGNGIERIVFNDDYTLTIYFTQTEPYTTGNIRGATGNGIQNIVLNDDYTLTINYTDGNSVTTDPIRGATGNGISGISFDSQNYTLTINFTDGESFTTGSIRGATGNGIASVRLNADYTLTLTYTDGNSATVGPIRGATGITPDITIGTVTTLAPNEPATAEMTGTPENPVLNLGLTKGDTGAIFTPVVSARGVLSWTNNGELPNPEPVDIPDLVTDTYVESIPGTDVTIVGEASHRYLCGEVYNLDITPPESGIIDVVFTSGSTVTILTLPQTVKMPDWWTGPESGYIYELNIVDSTYGTVMSWAV